MGGRNIGRVGRRCVRHSLTDDLPWLVAPAGFCHPSTWWTFDDALGMFGAMARSRLGIHAQSRP